MESLRTVSPIDAAVIAERPYARGPEIDQTLEAAQRAQQAWAALPLSDRTDAVLAFLNVVESLQDTLATELTLQMGRPARFAGGEIRGFLDRGRTMARLATSALSPIDPGPKEGFTRRIERVPLGTVFVLAPWNYPWLTAVNAVVPALLAGNAVVLKHADQTPLVAERMIAAGQGVLPSGLLSFLHVDHDTAATIVREPRVHGVAFTGSVEGGHAISKAAAGRFIPVGYELGGKDAAYVCKDSDVPTVAAALIDGAMFNSGQSCCAVERIYVARSRFDAFVEAAVAEARALTLGDPREAETTLGPVVRTRNAQAILRHVGQAVAAGAQALVGGETSLALPYLMPEVLIGVTHEMDVMREETFGPVVGIMPVDTDADAITHINDSRYGLTASIWTSDIDRANAVGRQLDVGTVFMNRCDYLDPELAWTGVRDSGRGRTLSVLGFDGFTRAKSFHLRHTPG